MGGVGEGRDLEAGKKKKKDRIASHFVSSSVDLSGVATIL